MHRFTAYVCLLIAIPIAATAQDVTDVPDVPDEPDEHVVQGAPDTQDAAAVQRLPSVKLPAELDRVLRDYEKAWAAGDAAGLADLFTEDGFVRSPGGWIRGHEAIRGKYASAGGALRLRAVAYSVDGSSGYIVGAYGYGAADTFEDRGVFVLALRRSDSDAPWLIAADLDNSINR